jgi:hypothetical protein
MDLVADWYMKESDPKKRNQPLPIGPQQEWHQSQSLEYVISADRAILDIAAKLREDFLYRLWYFPNGEQNRALCRVVYS